MFQKDIEKNIIEFIKKSPIGVTSSEIARYLGISRITITKYLAIIKEKTLIDFKQFGMAKLWFIPVEINKESFLNKITVDLASDLWREGNKKALREAGIKMGKHFYSLYTDHFRVDKMSIDQGLEALDDAYDKIGGNIKILEKTKNKVHIRFLRSQFNEDSSDNFILYQINAGILGGMFSKISDYCKVTLKPAEDNGLYDVIVFLKKTKTSDEEKGIEFCEKAEEKKAI